MRLCQSCQFVYKIFLLSRIKFSKLHILSALAPQNIKYACSLVSKHKIGHYVHTALMLKKNLDLVKYACSQHGMYLGLNWLLPVHYKCPAWTLSGQTDPNMVPMFHNMVPTSSPRLLPDPLQCLYKVMCWQVSNWGCYLFSSLALCGPYLV